MNAILSSGKRIPTILGIFGVLVSVFVVALTSRQIGQITKTFSQAASSPLPASVGIANISDTSATIYWLTDKETTGGVFYGKTPKLGDGVGTDTRDASTANNKYLTHLVTIANLKPETKYFFKIGVGSDSYGDPGNKNQPYEFTTTAKSQGGQIVEPIFGKILDEAGSPLLGSIVVWDSTGAQKVVSLSKKDGSYVLPIGTVSQSEPVETITFIFSGIPTTTISCKTGLDRPLPTIKIGENLDCTKGSSSLGSTSGFKAPTAPTGLQQSPGDVDIGFENGKVFSTGLPTISGKAGPNQIVQIVVRSEIPYSGTVQADSSGNWSWTPPANLAPGQHTVTITVINPDGKSTVVTRTFTVSSGSPILPVTSGTPSAQLTHFACAGSTCSVVAGVGPNTCSVDTDCVVAPVSTPVTPPPPPPPPRPPATGSLENTLILLTFGLFFATLGGVTLFKPNGPKH